MSTTLFIGENTAQRDKAYKEYVNKFISAQGNMAIDYVNVEDANFSEVVDAVTTVPFLSNKRMVVIKYLSSKKELADKLEQIINRASDTTDVVFVETTVDNRSIYAKTLLKKVDNVHKFSSLDGADLVDWLVDDTYSKGGKISRGDAQYLIDRIGHNQQLLANEIIKMLLVCKEIDQMTIDEMTEASPHSSVFNMLDALMQGRIDVASKLYDEQRAQGMEPQAIMGMVTWQLFILAALVTSNETTDITAKKFKISPFVARKNTSLAKRLNRRQMVDILETALNTDESIKTGKAKPDQEVHSLILQLGEKLS